MPKTIKFTQDKIDLLNAIKDNLKNLSQAIKRKNVKIKAFDRLENFDGDGKLFEAYLLSQLKISFQQLGATVEIRDCAKRPHQELVFRGGPGKLTRRTKRSAPSAAPGYISVTLGNGAVFEIHNSVEWPDRLMAGKDCHELDISIAEEAVCDDLHKWGLDGTMTPTLFPSLGVECKFHGAPPDKALAREVTGLAARLIPQCVYLATSTVPPDGIRNIIQSVRGWTLHSRTITHAEAITISMIGSPATIDARPIETVASDFKATFG